MPNKNGACGLLYLRFPQPVWQICPLWCLPNICSRTNQFCRVHTANNHIPSFDTMIFQRFVIAWQVFHLRCVKIIISCCACFQYLIGAFFFSCKAFSCVQCLYVVRQRNRFRYRTKQFDKSGFVTPLIGRSTWNSVDPNPIPLWSPFATAPFPFSMHGVIFANNTSFSAKYVKPVLTSSYFFMTVASISPCSVTAGIGTNDTSTPLPSRLSCPFLGLMWHALPSATSPQPNSFDPGMPNSSINRDWQSTDEFPV